jgi:3',5'-cyclic AMP phosphodiesterase CpdA
VRTIAHISDLHFDRVEPDVVEALVRELHAQAPSLTVISGDFTQRGRAGQFKRASAFLDRLPRPQLCTPGNHDIPLYNLIRRFFFPLARYRRHITANLRPVFVDSELLVIGINSARSFTFRPRGFWKDGRISQSQLNAVEWHADLAPEIFKIVVTHHPFIPPPHERIHGIVHGAVCALEEMGKHHIDLLLAGHLHMGYSGDVRTHHEAVTRSILSIQAGTATSTRRRGEPNAYNLITITPDHVNLQIRRWDGRAFVDGDRTQFNRVAGNWQQT